VWRRSRGRLLRGKPLTEATAQAAAAAAFADALTHGELKFKPELGRRALVRALLQARTMEV
jgi:xanthine dehydrogenase YagS FAD-binding subunit